MEEQYKAVNTVYGNFVMEKAGPNKWVPFAKAESSEIAVKISDALNEYNHADRRSW